MFELLVTLCMAGDPEACEERRVPTAAPMTVELCEASGSARAEAVASARPEMTLRDWHCVVVEASGAGAGDALTVEEVAEGIFVHRGLHATPTPQNGGDLANIGFVIGEEAVAVVDAGGSARIGAGLLAAIRARTEKPVRYLVLTHMHPDHVLGAVAFREAGAQVIGHANLEQALLARAETYTTNIRRLVGDEAFAGTEIVLPETGVADRMEIDLGGRVLLLEAHPTAHTSTDLTVYDAQTGTWFLGDLLFSGHTPALDGSITGWIGLMEKLSAREVARVVPGHGRAAMAWPEGAAPEIAYLRMIAMQTRAAIKAGDTLGEAVKHVGQEAREDWELFDEFNARNVTAAYTELEWEQAAALRMPSQGGGRGR